MFYTYILYSTLKDKFYVGASENPNERLKKHNNKNNGFTNQTKDWEILFTKSFDTKSEALYFERKIKNWKSAKMIRKLIEESANSGRPDESRE